MTMLFTQIYICDNNNKNIYILIYEKSFKKWTQAMQFGGTSFKHSWINRNLRNFIELWTVTSVNYAWILNKKNKRTKLLNKINSRS